MSKDGKRTAWMNKELLSLFKHKQKIHRGWKLGPDTWNEYIHVSISRNETRKTKAQTELNLPQDVKSNKKSFRHIRNKSKTKNIVGSLLSGGETLITEDSQKSVSLKAFFASVFTDKTRHQESLIRETRLKDCWKEFPLVKENWIRKHLGHLDIHKSVSPGGIHQQVLRKLADTITRTLTINHLLKVVAIRIGA